MALKLVKLVGQGLNNTIITGGLVPKGAYAAGTDYAVGDSVDYNGSSYVMHTDAAAGTVPTNTSYWQVLADKGATGAAGADGADGADGSDGADGASSYTYVAYASDDSGTDFTTTFDANLDYIAFKTTTSPIASPQASDFTGLWKNYKGATGATGATGAAGADGADGLIQSVVAGSNITVDDTDPANPIVSGSASGASQALDNLASVAINTSLISDTDSTDDLGSSSKYWANTYTDKIYLNATASLDGSVAGTVTVTGNLTATNLSGTNTGDVTKAAGSDITTGTNDTLFATAKALKDAHVLDHELVIPVNIVGAGGGENTTSTSYADISYLKALFNKSAYTNIVSITFQALLQQNNSGSYQVWCQLVKTDGTAITGSELTATLAQYATSPQESGDISSYLTAGLDGYRIQAKTASGGEASVQTANIVVHMKV